MVPRLYVPLLDARSRTVTLPEDEAAHLRRVLRVKAGDDVRLFDGRGGEVDATVISAGRAGVVVEIGAPVVAALEWPVRVTLAQAVLKGEKIDDVIRDAVMMGVAAIQPLLTARTEVPAEAFSRGRRVDRWQRIAVASAKQCGRAVVPRVLAPCSLQACLGAGRQGPALMLVEPAASIPGRGSWPLADTPSSATLLVGPEGGWAGDEVALALETGCLTLTLGPRTLRADAAAIVAISVMQFVWR